jgi:hypothetical protein
MDGSSNLYKACVDCKKPRKICVRVRRPELKDFGHAHISVHETMNDGSEKVTTYGNWPSSTWFNRGNDLQRDYKGKGKADDGGDDFNTDKRWKPEDVKCKTMTQEEEDRLKEQINKKQLYDYTDNNCARWAGSTWNNVTGDNLSYGASSNTVYNSPTTLLNSMNASP